MTGDTCFGQAPFIRITPALFESGLNVFAIAVWCALARWADKDGKCWRPIRLLAQDIGQSERTVRRAIATLKQAGWIKVTLHRGAHSEYRLIWHGSDVVPMQTTEESEVTQAALLNTATVKPAQQREKDEKRGHTGRTSEVTQAADLIVLSKWSKEKERAFPDPLFSSTEKQGKSESNQDKAQADPMTPLVPVARHRRLSLDEAWQADQQDRLNNKHPGGKA